MRECGVQESLVRVHWSLQNQIDHCVHILGVKSSSFSVQFELCSWTVILFVVFKMVWNENLRSRLCFMLLKKFCCSVDILDP